MYGFKSCSLVSAICNHTYWPSDISVKPDEFWGDGKVILIAHTPCENLYLKNMDYVVFNDLVNQKRCTEELLKHMFQSFCMEIGIVRTF